MTTNTKVTCDGCGHDITHTGNSVDWRISVRNERIPSRPGAVTDMGIPHPLKQNYDFCGLRCLQRTLCGQGVG